ncbi:hypothetical protein HWC35_gp038 [Vibrio phage USC-1]|uniref:Uncharacterized protein n=2 Tax=Aphroditevirus USC1 TaxID=2846605 RepID=A0A514A2I5_9CAUD|nr:hypothetical protein HWC35_gp038 [Vibrio phage USC-1]QCW23296.1 hypothetical protein [Vibrio phage 5 TSL-2019]QDH47432.1 hypothetical protein [Vibrio phage USC-1]
MKVVSGGIPGRPQHTTGAGDVYTQLHRIAFARAEQITETDRQTQTLNSEVTGLVNVNYSELNKKLTDHINSKGPQHGETLETLGLSMVGDFPFTHVTHIQAGVVYDEYVTPKTLGDALHAVNHKPDGTLLPVKRSYFTGVDVPKEPIPNINIHPTETDDGLQWVQGKVLSCGMGEMFITYPETGKQVYVINGSPGAKRIHLLKQLGVEDSSVVPEVHGWNACCLRRQQSFRRFHGYLSGESFGVVGYDQNDELQTGNHVTWMDPDPINGKGYAGFITADVDGVKFGLVQHSPLTKGTHAGVNGDGFTGYGGRIVEDTNAYRFTFEGIDRTKTYAKVSWNALTGKTGIKFEHSEVVHGGFEWLDYGRELFAFLCVNLSDADGNQHTAYFGWEIDLRNPKAVSCTRLNTPFDWSTSAIPQLDKVHPFHPLHGASVFRPQGGHATVHSYNLQTFVLDHIHDIRSLRELYDRCLEIPTLPLSTELRLNQGLPSFIVDSQYGRSFFQGKDTLIIGAPNAIGEWTYQHQIQRAQSFESRLISEMKEFDQECVNTITENDATLTGLVWSTENMHQAKGTIRGVVGKGMLGKPAYLTDSSLTKIKLQHKAFLAENQEDAYACVLVYPEGSEYVGLEMRCDNNSDVYLARLNVTLVGGRYDLDRIGDFVKVYEGNGKVPNAPTNLRRFLKRDFYVNYKAGSNPKVTLQNPIPDRTLLVTVEVTDTITVDDVIAPVANEFGLTQYRAVMTGPNGVALPDLNVSNFSFNDSGKKFSLGGIPNMGPMGTIPNLDTTVVIGGRPYTIPTSFYWMKQGETDPKLNFELKDGELCARVLDGISWQELEYTP